MKYLPILILCFIFLCSSSENNQVPKVLFAEPEISANVYDAEGNIIGKITNSVNNDQFLTLSLYKISDNRAFVSARYIFDDTFQISGYIDAKYLGIRTINKDTLFLYEEPNIDSKYRDTIINSDWSDMYKVISLSGKWLYIESYDETTVNGWLSPEDQDAYPVTPAC